VISRATDEMNAKHLEYQIENFVKNNPNKNDDVEIEYVTYKKDSTIIEESQQLKFATRLKELGYKYDGEGWDIKDKNGKEVTCYGFVWDYWYDLDTCVREMVSDIFEECCEE
jgi:hypothetical protein